MNTQEIQKQETLPVKNPQYDKVIIELKNKKLSSDMTDISELYTKETYTKVMDEITERKRRDQKEKNKGMSYWCEEEFFDFYDWSD